MKKLLLSLGTVAAAIAPIATVVACGDDAATAPSVTTEGTKTTIKYDLTGDGWDWPSLDLDEDELMEKSSVLQNKAVAAIVKELSKDSLKTMTEVVFEIKTKSMNNENEYTDVTKNVVVKLSETKFSTLNDLITGVKDDEDKKENYEAKGMNLFVRNVVLWGYSLNDYMTTYGHVAPEVSIDEIVQAVQDSEAFMGMFAADMYAVDDIIALTEDQFDTTFDGTKASFEKIGDVTTIAVNVSSGINLDARKTTMNEVLADIIGFDKDELDKLVDALQPIIDEGFTFNEVSLIVDATAAAPEETIEFYLTDGYDAHTVSTSNLTFVTA